MEQVTVDKLDELVSRTRRIETRLTRLCLHMNADAMGDKGTIGYVLTRQGEPALDLPGLDVGVGECLRFCTDKGIFGLITLIHRGREVGTVTVALPEGARG